MTTANTVYLQISNIKKERKRSEMSLPHLSWRALSVLVALACAACSRSAEEGEKANNSSTIPSQNGIYAVLRVAATAEDAQGGDSRCAVLTYDRKYTDSGAGQPIEYVAIDPSAFVPLILDGAPSVSRDEVGKTILSVTIKNEYVKTLEDFTRAHLGGKIAVLLGGEIVTLHKVRSVISDGKFLVTRCTDNACEVLRARLTE